MTSVSSLPGRGRYVYVYVYMYVNVCMYVYIYMYIFFVLEILRRKGYDLRLLSARQRQVRTSIYALQAVTDAHGVDAHGVGANSAQPHGLG